MVLLEGYVASCGGLRAQRWCGIKPPSITPTIMFLNDIRSPCHIHVTSTHLHFIYIHAIHLHASRLPIRNSPPCPSIHGHVITVKVGGRVSYSRDRVCLSFEISDTDKELSLNHRSTQIGSRTLQQTTSSSRTYLLM